jgi:3',5'-cyclic AMP phosphodiesterase CpdA
VSPETQPAARRIVHLSDLHIAETTESKGILRRLPAALAAYLRTADGPPVASIFVTGDVFDSSDYDPPTAMARFVELYRALMAAFPAPVPVVLLPGNHDRRKAGVIGPHDRSLFVALAAAAQREKLAPVFVAGRQGTRAERVPPVEHGTAAHVATYDSTVLVRGYFSAGGDLRREDLLWLIATLSGGAGPHAPLFLLTHHHIVPTPLTDVGRVDVQGRGAVSRWLIQTVLPEIVSNADHEELTMTALGAGTTLSTLHGVGRPVVVLHGHKHYPAARLVVGAEPGENDVILLAAGSAGVAEAWSPTGDHDTGHLWPSFNVLEHGPDDALTVRTVAFSARDGRLAPPRLLIDVRRDGLRWQLGPRAPEDAVAPAVDRNAVRFTLSDAGNRWHLEGRRSLTPLGSRTVAYVEVVEGAPGATARDIDDGGTDHRPVPFGLSVSTARAESSYFLENAVCQTVDAAERAYGAGTAFEWVGLVNRVAAREAVLEVEGLPAGQEVFASVTDMANGRERVVPVERVASGHRVVCAPCAARRMLRLYIVLPGALSPRRR